MEQERAPRVSLWVVVGLAFAAQVSGQKASRPSPAHGSMLPVPGAPLSFQRYHPTLTPFPGTHERDHLGSGLAVLGDLDGNGVSDVALGASDDHVLGDCRQGAVWIQFMAASGDSIGQRKLRQGEGGFEGVLDPLDAFGSEVAALGDLDLDGIPDLAVGAPGDDDFGTDAGAVWILFLRADGTVKSHAKILPPIVSVQAFGAQGAPDIRVRRFGLGLAGLGDLDGDGSIEVAVGAQHGDLPAEDSGAVWILSLRRDGSVLSATKISAADGGFQGHLDPEDDFGFTLGVASDLDGNGVVDLLVGAPGDDDSIDDTGAVWRLSLEADGTVVTERKISASASGGPPLNPGSRFGEAAAEIGDLDADGVPDLAVGAPTVGSSNSLYILFLNADGSVKSFHRHFVPLDGDLANLEPRLGWAASVAALGDQNGNGIPEVLAAAPGRGDPNYGHVWRLDLRSNGTLRTLREYGLEGWTAPAFVSPNAGSTFGSALLSLGDRDGDGGVEIAVGQPRDNALWICHLDPALAVAGVEKWSRATGFPQGLFMGDDFGASVAVLGDLDGNGFDDLAVGAPGDEDGHTSGGDPGQFSYGAVWVFFLGAGGAVLDIAKISELEGNLTTPLTQETEFGVALAPLGDLDGDGVPDLAVGAQGRSIPFSSSGSVFILFLNPDGTVRAETRFFAFNGLSSNQRFGGALAYMGGGWLAIGEPILDAGGIWMAKLGPDGLPGAYFQIGLGMGGFSGWIEPGDRFGSTLAPLGDLDGDGGLELAVGAPGSFTSDQGPNQNGLVWILFLDGNGLVRAEVAIGPEHPSVLQFTDAFGWTVGSCGDLSGDGVPDLLVGNLEDRFFPIQCEPSSGTFGILALEGNLAPAASARTQHRHR